MKVLHVIPSVGPLRGGPSVAVLGMCRALEKEGVECHIVCTNDNGEEILKVPTGQWTQHDGVQTWFLQRQFAPVKTMREFQVGRGFSPWLTEQARHYDLFHIHALFSHLPSVAMAHARRHDIPYVLRPLGILESYSLGRSAWRKRIFLALFDAANIRQASALHFTSQREELVSLRPKEVPRWVVPLGVEVPSGCVAEGRGVPPRIVFLSRWDEKKRIDLLIEALALLKDLAWELVLAGSGEAALSARMHELVRNGHLEERVSFPGFVTGEAKWQLLRSADVFVLPSASENFGIAAAEALALGVPVIVSRQVALWEEIKSDEAGWVCGEDAPALAQLLRAVLAAPAERRRRGKNAVHLAQNSFSWRTCAEKLTDGYGSLLRPN